MAVGYYAVRYNVMIKTKYPMSSAISIITHLCLLFGIESQPDTRLVAVALRDKESRIIKGTVKYRRTSAARATRDKVNPARFPPNDGTFFRLVSGGF